MLFSIGSVAQSTTIAYTIMLLRYRVETNKDQNDITITVYCTHYYGAKWS